MFIRLFPSATLSAALIAAAALHSSQPGFARDVPAEGVLGVPTAMRPAEWGVGQWIPDWTFSDVTGVKRSLHQVRGKAATVIALTSTSCPISRKLQPALRALEADFGARGVSFLYVNSIATDKAAGPEDGSKAIFVPYAADALNLLRAQSTTEVFVLDAAGTLAYRGAVNDQYGVSFTKDAPTHHYLRDALASILEGREPAMQATTAPGCALDLPEKDAAKPGAQAVGATAPITYHETVSRIVQRNCVECHRSGGVGPFSLETMDDVIAHAGMVKKMVSKNLMPPWFAAPEPVGHSRWRNNRSLTEGEKSALLAWLDGPRSAGDPRNAPVPRQLPAIWSIGEPEMIVQLPEPISVKAEGRMPYQNVFVKVPTTEDRWVESWEVLPTAREVVHHVLVFVIPKDKADPENLRRSGSRSEQDGFFAAYVPGTSMVKYPEGFGKMLPAGATIHFQLHYTPTGKPAKDQTRIGFRFAKESPKHLVRTTGIANVGIRIPAGAGHHPERASLRVPMDAQVTAFMPHMHVRGKAFKFEAVDRTGLRTPLLDIPAYDFNWQLTYRLAEPMHIPAGTVIECTAIYDNSTANPANPDPKRLVTWGPQTEDEMMIGYLEYFTPNEEASPEAMERAQFASAATSIIFSRLDLNTDGKLVDSEVANSTFFALLDSNQDAGVTLEEAQTFAAKFAQKERPGMAPGPLVFTMLDKDRDGRIVESELPKQLQKRVAQLDKNNDGAITPDEMPAAVPLLGR